MITKYVKAYADDALMRGESETTFKGNAMSYIYHYCDTNAFQSIVERDVLWLSSVYFMNDTAEMLFFREKIVRPLMAAMQRNSGLSNYDHSFKTALEKLTCYSLCFSEDGDSLYHWQAYGGKGKGLSIGFDSDVLCKRQVEFELDKVNFTSSSIARVELAKVLYKSEDDILNYINAKFNEDTMIALAPGSERGKDTFTQVMSIACKVIKKLILVWRESTD